MKVNRLKYFRVKNNLTQKELAGKIHCTAQYISDVEVGKYDMSEKMLIRAAEVFDVQVDDLYGEKTV